MKYSLSLHYKQRRGKSVGTPFPHVPAPIYPCPISCESEIHPEPLNAVMYHLIWSLLDICKISAPQQQMSKEFLLQQ